MLSEQDSLAIHTASNKSGEVIPENVLMSPPKQDKSGTFATRLQHSASSPSDTTMLPEPALSFTIPSIHDDTTTLECRIYHPQSLLPNPRAPPFRKQAAIIAHPYAPLGGCFDDAVVETIAAVLLRQGFVVGTFNFRGAGNSTGRASWTSKAEIADYTSFAAFVCYYIHYLDPFRSPPDANEPSPALLLCGYSYGAMITKLLPPLPTLLAPFANPKTASAAADIRLRAQHLAEKQNLVLASARSASLSEHDRSPMSPRKAAFGGGPGLRVGGEEDLRRSQELGRRSFSLDAEEKIRKGVAELMARGRAGVHGHKRKKGDEEQPVSDDGLAQEEKEADVLQPVADMMRPRVGYLLVSPPIGWATNLLTLNLGGFFGRRSTKSPKVSEATAPTTSDDATELTSRDSHYQSRQKLLDNPTLAIYGDADMFVTAKRFREWASKLQAVPGSKFRAHEVSTAGHFYVQEGTLQRLADAVRVFAGEMTRIEVPVGQDGV